MIEYLENSETPIGKALRLVARYATTAMLSVLLSMATNLTRSDLPVPKCFLSERALGIINMNDYFSLVILDVKYSYPFDFLCFFSHSEE